MRGVLALIVVALALTVATVIGARYAMALTPPGPVVCGSHGGAALCYTRAG